MRYIRTKDEVYSTNELIKCEDKRFPDGWFTKSGVPLIAINQADTIEELFSAFVLKGIDLIHLNEEHTQYRFEGDDEWFDINDTELRVGIYGAIWTEKGLIYVAKLNDKKEFELL